MSDLADAVATLALVDTWAGFNEWWRPRVTAINRAAAYDPDEFERIAKAIDAMHARRRAKEGTTT